MGGRYAYTAEDTQIALSHASSRAACVVGYETGHTFDPNQIGALGELGPVQLLHPGKLDDFYAQGYLDPFNPYEAIPFLDSELAKGHGSAWSPILLGLC